MRRARLTAQGLAAYDALVEARLKLLDRVLANWADGDREALGRLLLRFARALKAAVKSPS